MPEKSLDEVKDFQQIRKLSGLLENFPDYLETVKDCLEVNSLSGIFTNDLEVSSFQRLRFVASL